MALPHTKEIMRKLLAIISLSVLFVCCGQNRSKYVRLEGFALGTTYSFILQMHDTTGLQNGIDSLFKTIDMSMSVFNPSSLINRVNNNMTDSVDQFIAYCISVARKVSEISGGAYDITVKPVTEALGYSGGKVQQHPNIDSLLQYVGYDKITVTGNRLSKANSAMQIDLNSVAKGYACDLMGEFLEDKGVADYIIEIGGEIFCKGKSPRGGEWRIGIDRPSEGNMIPGKEQQATISLSGKGLATSGNYRQFYIDSSGRKVTHIVDARTGKSGLSDVLSATVIARTCAEADAAATMLTIVGLDQAQKLLEQHNEWDALLIYDDGKDGFTTYTTENLRGQLNTEKKK